ncbi:MAG: hypothetical protein ACUVV4_07960 [Candidatus Bathyarchaeia archaeon]
MEHNQIRERKKSLSSLVSKFDAMGFRDFKSQLSESSKALAELLRSHFFKENNILFPTVLKVVTDDEWGSMRREFDEIGYCCFTPPIPEATMVSEPLKARALKEEGVLEFETGSLSKNEVEAILDTIPVDVTFVDVDDTVK